MIRREIARKIADAVFVYGVPVIIVSLMISVVNIYSPLMNAAPPHLPQPVVQYYSYRVIDKNSTIILFFNTRNIEFVNVYAVNISIGGKIVKPLKTLFSENKLYLQVDPSILKDACLLGKYIDLRFVGVVRYLNSTALFKSYGIRIVYSCNISVKVWAAKNYIEIHVKGPAWISSEGLELNITIRLYNRSSTGSIRLVNTTRIIADYYGLPLIIPVPSYGFGYVFVEYVYAGKTVREGFYIEPRE